MECEVADVQKQLSGTKNVISLNSQGNIRAGVTYEIFKSFLGNRFSKFTFEHLLENYNIRLRGLFRTLSNIYDEAFGENS